MSSSFPAVVDLNVGGRHLTTSLSTLTKYPNSVLATMFSGRHPVSQDQDGRYFIDVDGDVFVHVLNFLRFGTMPPPERASGVREYAKYFALQELEELLPTDFEKVLSGIWKMKLCNYQSYWEKLERQIPNLSSKYFYIRVRSPHNCGADPRIRTIGFPVPDRSNIIDLHLSDNDNDVRPTVLLNLLAYDLKNLNIFTDYCETECMQCGCKSIMRFKIGM